VLGSTIVPRLEVYSQKYKHVRFTRRNGILELRLHTDGNSLIWASLPHEELGYCFADVADDPENKVVIITGEGSSFCADIDLSSFGEQTPRSWLNIHQEGRRILNNLLNIEVPVISAVNGRALVHAELALLSNIVIASEDTTFQDRIHFPSGAVPGDGAHVVWPTLLGPIRGSRFLLTGQVLDAKEALELGVVNEVVPRAELLPRAWAVAEEIAGRPVMARRYARLLLTHEMKRLMHDQLSYGLVAEGLALLDQDPS